MISIDEEKRQVVFECLKHLKTHNKPSKAELDALGLNVSGTWRIDFITIDKLLEIEYNFLKRYLYLVLKKKAKKRIKARKKKRNCGNNPVKFLRKSAKKTSTHSTVYVVLMWKGREKFIKVGMTTTSIDKRFCNLPYNYKVIHSVDVEKSLLFEYEQAIHGLIKANRYRPTIKFGGHTECYTMDAKSKILSLLA